MAVSITRISPGRGRPTDLVTITGDGFSATPGQNTVTFDGVTAGINSDAVQSLQVVVPLGISVDQHVTVVVTNLDDATSFTWYWWAKDTITNTDALIMATKIPGFSEQARGLGRLVKNMNVAEARFFERLATKALLLRDILDAKGTLASRAATPLGLRRAAPGVAGQPFVSAIDTVGGQFQDRQCQTLSWGLTIDGGTLTGLMEANGTDTVAAATVPYQVALDGGQLALVSMRERTSATSRVTRIELFVDDVSVLVLLNGDPDFPGPGLQAGESLTFYPGIRIAQGARVSIQISRNNTTTTVNVLAFGLVV